ncbi:MAG TPA: ACP S-malonyltransferase [Ktedonobacterales bacterium]|nr:ACP S-malonyltransferase [Ktedonobacterales bacterium]
MAERAETPNPEGAIALPAPDPGAVSSSQAPVRVAFVFPGQGSQAVGMGADVAAASPAARAIFDAADEALGFALARLCFEGPEEILRETVNTQPALVTTSLALLAALQEAAGDAPIGATSATASDANGLALRQPLTPAFVAGHSIGEYTALAVAGALAVADTVRLARERGRLMHAEGQAIPSGMAAVLGMDADALTAICAEATTQAQGELATQGGAAHPGAGRVVVANDNAPGQVVISGERRALDVAMELAKARGAKRVVPLTVSGAFHSPVMAPAAQGLAMALASAPLRDAAIPIISNITATPLTAANDLRDELAQQIVSPVQWTRTVQYLADQGVTTFVEIGAGQVLAGLIKRIAKGATVLSVSAAADVASVAAQLRAGGV